jgi:hypothetical protein
MIRKIKNEWDCLPVFEILNEIQRLRLWIQLLQPRRYVVRHYDSSELNKFFNLMYDLKGFTFKSL